MQKDKKSELSGNAKTAFSELAAMVGLGKEAAAGSETPAAAKTPAAETKVSYAHARTIESAPTAAKTIIAEGTVIDGNIHTEASIDCFGKVKGDIVSKGTVYITGDHTGNIHGNKVSFSNAVIQGNIVAEGEVNIGTDTRIVGNINAGGVVLSGTVTGSITAKGLVSFESTALLSGNVQSVRIAVADGARISGEIKMNLPEEVKKQA